MKQRVIILILSLSILFLGCAKRYTLLLEKSDAGTVLALENGNSIKDFAKIRDGSFITLQAYPVNGYRFVSWSLDIDENKNPLQLVMDSDKKIKANFEKIVLEQITHKVTFNANGGVGTMADQIITQGESANLKTNAFTKIGYDFKGWSTTKTGSVEYADKAVYTMGSAEATLYAVWENLIEIINVPIPLGGLSFPFGTDDTKVATVSKPYYIGATEVTYKLWEIVYSWTKNNGYTFANIGQKGLSPDGVGMTELHPVTSLNWRDTIVFCNAVTEWFNTTQPPENRLECVYYTDAGYITPLRVSTNSATITATTQGSEDCPYIKATADGNTDMANCTAKGFRLPTQPEWECAARWQGKVALNSNYVDPNPTGCTAGYFWTKGDSASGATANYSDATETGKVAVYGANSGSKTAEVKSKLPNGLGLYDISGNVIEWNNDRYKYENTFRFICGGHCLYISEQLRIGYSLQGFSPLGVYNYLGLRLARF